MPVEVAKGGIISGEINDSTFELAYHLYRVNKEFNADFNRESGKSEDFFNQEGNFWIKLHHKIYG